MITRRRLRGRARDSNKTYELVPELYKEGITEAPWLRSSCLTFDIIDLAQQQSETLA
jgi:hypothetical protein